MAKAPLFLDVDGTLLKTDLLFEAFWAGLGQSPLATLGACARHWRRPAALKSALADIVSLRYDLMPLRKEVLALANDAREEGHVVGLASASDQRMVAGVAEANGIDGPLYGSDGERNLKGAEKSSALIKDYGQGGFIYAGDSAADLAVWEKAQAAIVVGSHKTAERSLAAKGISTTPIAGGWSHTDLIRALRPHQWVKNILLLLPMIAAHEFTLATFGLVLLGMVAFSAAASSIYVVNDLLDLEADRLHVKKCRRPFASGAVPIQVGMAACAFLIALALGLGELLGPAFFGVVVLYMLLSLAYSLKLKRLRWVDIATLASLYTLRVVAGAAATQVEASAMMLIFIFPVFVSLGCVKRLTELTLATSDERLPGRGYGRPDRGDLLNVASLGVVGALLVFFLYSFSEQALTLYPTRWILWVTLVPIALWLIRMVALGYAGKQDYDPIVFALRDKMGIGILLIILSMMFYAAGLWAVWFNLAAISTAS
ncbi:MAG: UbiA family prenyltransferase [Pseudomonadota bacterium]